MVRRLLHQARHLPSVPTNTSYEGALSRMLCGRVAIKEDQEGNTPQLI